MQKEAIHYSWDRLLRAHARGPLMTDAQRADLADDILSGDPPKNLADAVAALQDGTLTDEDVTGGYEASRVEGFNLAEFRASLASAPDITAAVNERIRALTNQS
jgi:hypothetical protein